MMNTLHHFTVYFFQLQTQNAIHFLGIDKERRQGQALQRASTLNEEKENRQE